MDNVIKVFQTWKNNINNKEYLDVLNRMSQEQVYESFYKNLEFGTAGLRGIMGLGTNRMNIYTVRQTTQGFANYLKIKFHDDNNIAVAISYDSRNNSREFAIETAKVLSANNVKVYITDELKPTPVLSFAVRYLRCQGGIMITASHNPPQYNGYKCYGTDGAQILDYEAKKIYENIEKVDIFNDVKLLNFEDALKSKKIEFIDKTLYEEYIREVIGQGINKSAFINSDLKVVYTPLNGAGNKAVREVMERIGIKNFYVVPEQENPDGNFTTCQYPNPEFEESFTLAKDVAKNKKADIIISTDPDSDRIGVCVYDGGKYVFLSGNQIGILLLHYILEYRKINNNLKKKPVIVRTIVSTNYVDKIAKKYNCEVIKVLTGFKYIGNEILKLEKKGECDRYILGFEESHGYLVGTYTRDKDAVVTSMLICEMAAFYKRQSITLLNVLENIGNEYGGFYSKNINIKFSGNKDDMNKIQNIMQSLRKTPMNAVGGLEVKNVVDYMLNVDNNLPKSNILYYELEGDSTLIIRPSGTEPKIKIYIMSDSSENLNNIYEDINNKFFKK